MKIEDIAKGKFFNGTDENEKIIKVGNLKDIIWFNTVIEKNDGFVIREYCGVKKGAFLNNIHRTSERSPPYYRWKNENPSEEEKLEQIKRQIEELNEAYL